MPWRPSLKKQRPNLAGRSYISRMNSWGLQISLWGCPFVKWIGIPCMGWGLTRSFYATATGDLAAVVNVHLFGPFLFLGFMIATVHWSIELLSGRDVLLDGLGRE